MGGHALTQELLLTPFTTRDVTRGNRYENTTGKPVVATPTVMDREPATPKPAEVLPTIDVWLHETRDRGKAPMVAFTPVQVAAKLEPIQQR